MANINQFGYRIGITDRTDGEATDTAEGFVVLNQTNGNVFTVTGGVWVLGGTFPADLYEAWFATVDGTQYRIGNTDRTIGDDSNAPEGFLVLNQTNGNVFESVSGLWADGGIFPSDVYEAWLGA